MINQGQFPDQLDELAPASIELVPRDPFDGQPMRLARTDRGWAIYSVGPDLTDDHGHPFDRQTKAGDLTFSSAEPQ